MLNSRPVENLMQNQVKEDFVRALATAIIENPKLSEKQKQEAQGLADKLSTWLDNLSEDQIRSFNLLAYEEILMASGHVRGESNSYFAPETHRAAQEKLHP